MTVRTPDSEKVTVVLTPSTEVVEPEGLFRNKHLAVTALIPGLQVKVKGSYNPQNQLVADQVEFSGSSLQAAEDIQAGLAPTQKQVQAQQQALQKQEQQIKAEQAQSAAHEAQIAAADAKIAANKAAIAEDNKRFGELGEYNILGEATVYFANGSVTIEPQYKEKLSQLANQAKGITAYVLLVQGYA
jgi:outer membrane protein OmpA-like peptidoglycan-associated protein